MTYVMEMLDFSLIFLVVVLKLNLVRLFGEEITFDGFCGVPVLLAPVLKLVLVSVEGT